MLSKYFYRLLNPSCKKKKYLAFLISDVNISHHRGLTSFVQQEWFRCVNSPVYCVIFPAMTGNPELHHK